MKTFDTKYQQHDNLFLHSNIFIFIFLFFFDQIDKVSPDRLWSKMSNFISETKYQLKANTSWFTMNVIQLK